MLLQISEPQDSSLQKKKKPELAIGIDLGTTNSLVATVLSGRARVLTDEEGCVLMPSVIHEPTNTIGNSAIRYKDAKRSFKSHMGSADPEKAKEAVVLSAQVLATLKKRAEDFYNAPVTKTVITVPAYFDEAARLATKQAAAMADLDVLRLINEPTAAALAYGLEKGLEGMYLVYDFGGGTFDASLLKLHKGVFQVIATIGDRRLGGDDVDLALARYLSTVLTFDYNIEPQDILLEAREIKEHLTNYDTGIFEFFGEKFSFDATIIDDVAGSLVLRTIELCRKLLLDAAVTVDDIKGVVLVGGSTRLKCVKQFVSQFFKKEPFCDLDPDQVVALGAALQAQALTSNATSSHLLLDVTPLSLGLEMMGGVVEKLIPRNSSIPCSVTQEFTTYEDNQTAMIIHVLQGERELVENCLSLGKFILTDIPAMPAGAARIQVTFQLDADGLLTVQAVEKNTQKMQSIELKPTHGLSVDDFYDLLKESAHHAKDDMTQRFWINESVKASHLVSALEKAFEKDSDLLSKDEIEALTSILVAIKALLEENDATKRDELNTLRTELNQQSIEFAQRRTTRAFKKALQKESASS